MKVNIIADNLDKKLEKTLNKVCVTAFKELKQNHHILEVNIAFVSADDIKQINTERRGVEKETDVLSFPNLDDVFNSKINKKRYKFEINPETKKVVVGDIVICSSIAKKQAEEFGHSETREICYLATHGILHLMGYDHEDENEREIMRSLEEKILKKNKLARI